jgi:hypothetical protein
MYPFGVLISTNWLRNDAMSGCDKGSRYNSESTVSTYTRLC